MTNLSTRTTLLLNWYANPYHTPIFVAYALGFYKQAGINLAILEPTDPSDVTEIVGLGKVDFGVKAMIHTVAANIKGYKVTSIGTLLDEPPTGLIALKSSGIKKFSDIVGKKIGYIGEFGKKIIDDLASLSDISPNSYQTIRVGMNITDAIKRGVVDTGIGFINFQKVELEHLYNEEITFLRIDQLAGLGCCCFCSIQFIVPERMMEHTEIIKNFLIATRRGANYTIEEPDQAYELLCNIKPHLRSDLYYKIFNRSLPFFSKNLENIPKDWEKVGKYCKHLKIMDNKFDINHCYSNEFLPNTPYLEFVPIAECIG